MPLRLKWPNDLYAEVNGGKELKKVGGMLVNSSFAQDEFLLVIGKKVSDMNASPGYKHDYRMWSQPVQPISDCVNQ